MISNFLSIFIPTCLFYENILLDIIAEKKVLIHCDAGRDRSGTISALLIAMAAEKAGLLDEMMIDAIASRGHMPLTNFSNSSIEDIGFRAE